VRRVVVILRIRLKTPRFKRWQYSWAAAACLALCASSTADMPAAPRQAATHPDSRADPRAARLERFFHIYHCPAPYHVSEYLRAADDYGLDYRLLPAVSIRETTCGVAETENNRWGFHNGLAGFSSIEAGIDFMAHRLAEHPYYKGKTLQQKLFTYNPLAAYPDEVTRIMRQIE
jgi:hypothetical protein